MPIVEDEALAIGKKIRQLRERAGWSQNKLAHDARVSASTVQEIEMGRREPHGLTLQKIATALDITLEELKKTPDRNAINGNGVDLETDDVKLSSNGNGSIPTTIDQIDHLLIGESEILRWVAQTARIALMMNRREAMYTLMGTVLAGLGLPGGDHAGAENDAVRSIAYGLDGQRVGGEAAKWARDQVAVLNQLAIRFSGQELYSIAEVNLRLLRTLLQARAATGQDDSELRLAIAHTASLTGWFAEDAELFDQASQHYHFAVEMAHSAGGHDFAVFSLTRLAATDLAKGQPAQCLAQLEATAAEAGQDSPWRSFIQMFAVEAYGKLGDISKAQRMLAKADVLY